MSSWSMRPFEFKVDQELLPSSLLQAQLLVGLEEGVSHDVCDYSKYTP